jgi:hypothetical protein
MSLPAIRLEAFKHMTKDFIEALKTANSEEGEAGFKCIALHYLNLDLQDKHEEFEAPIVLKIVSMLYLDWTLNLPVDAPRFPQYSCACAGARWSISNAPDPAPSGSNLS